MSEHNGREVWASRLGLIMAMAGNAIGLGNFLRFPVQAAANGGGAFMIPYFVAFLVVGIPMMWVEWSVGRFGGKHGHGTTPGILYRLWKHPAAKYIGVLGIAAPVAFALYYSYVQSWTLAYSFFSLTGEYFGISTQAEMGAFLSSFQGVSESSYFSGIATAYIFFLINLSIVFWVLVRGVVRGIETLAKFAMPMLLIFAIILVARVLTLGTPRPGLSGPQRHGRFRLDLEPGLKPPLGRQRLAGGRGTNLLLPRNRHRQHAVLRELRPRQAGRRPDRPDHFHEQRLRRGCAG